jgi:SAM-dependent methyltransferase
VTDGDRLLGTSISSYDLHARRFRDRRKDRSFANDALDRLAACLPKGGRVADAGCGPGYDAAGLRARGLSVVSMDLSRGMLDLAQEANPGRCVQTDLRHLPVIPGCLDGIWAVASLVHLSFDDVEVALREFRAALRDDGVLYVMVKHERGEGLTRQPADRDDPRARGFGGWRCGRDGPDDVRWFGCWNQSAFDAALVRAGFRSVGGSTNDDWVRRLARAE